MKHKRRFFKRGAFKIVSVNRVAHDWTADVFHMHADLMSPSGLDSHSHKGERAVRRKAFVDCARIFASVRLGCGLEALSVLRVADNLRLDFSSHFLGMPAANADIFFCD